MQVHNIGIDGVEDAMQFVAVAHREGLDATTEFVHAGEVAPAVVGARGHQVVLAGDPAGGLGDGASHGLMRGVLADEVDDAGAAHQRDSGRTATRWLRASRMPA